MKTRTRTITIFLLIFSCLQSAMGYSAIWNVDGWDRARLKEAGITVTTWKHDQIGEDPALNWVEIAFDSSKLREDQDAIMTLNVIADDHHTVSAHRVEHKKGEADKMKMLVAVRKENIGESILQIQVPKLLSKGSERDLGDPVFGGYSLSMSRIMQLAISPPADKPADKK